MAMLVMSTAMLTSFVHTGKPQVTSFNYQGDLPPVNYFDPLKLNSETNFKEDRVRYWREAELQHGRVAMFGATALPFLEFTNPGTLSINYLSNMDSLMQSPFWVSMFLYECVRMSNGWENPFVEGNKPFTLKKDYQPGNLFAYDKDNVSKTLYDNELSHGRLAMLTCAYIIGMESLTQKGLFI